MSASDEITAKRTAFLFTLSAELIATNKALRVQLGMLERSYEVTASGLNDEVADLFMFATTLRDENNELAAQLPAAA